MLVSLPCCSTIALRERNHFPPVARVNAVFMNSFNFIEISTCFEKNRIPVNIFRYFIFFLLNIDIVACFSQRHCLHLVIWKVGVPPFSRSFKAPSCRGFVPCYLSLSINVSPDNLRTIFISVVSNFGISFFSIVFVAPDRISAAYVLHIRALASVRTCLFSQYCIVYVCRCS